MSGDRQISWQVKDAERDELQVDVLIVGAGPASLACAIHLKRLLAQKKLEKQVLVLEKAEEVGHHILSGAVMDPRGMAELFPDWRARGCPIESEVIDDSLEMLLKGGVSISLKGAFVPPPLQNHGNFIISLNRVVRWLKTQAEAVGVDIYPGFSGAEILYDGARVVGVQTRDAGVGKQGEKRSSFQAGMNIKAAVTVFGEGTRGSLAKGLIAKFDLASKENPQAYGVGVKEIWEIPADRARFLKGVVTHTLGEPLGTHGYGGGWIYGLSDDRLSIGFVVGIDHPDPLMDPHALFVRWKQHATIREFLEGGKVIRYGAKSLPYGGYFAMPKRQGDGFVLVGDTAGFLNSARLKGVHLAIKSGLMAAEAIADALERNDTTAQSLAKYTELFENSWAKDELWKVRNFHQAFHSGFFTGLIDAGVQLVTGGRGLVERRAGAFDHESKRTIDHGHLKKPVYDGEGSMDKLTDVYWSGTLHDEHQPPHLVITDPSICATKCTEEYGNPCQHFCPAAVYEWPKDGATKKVVINASNCVHCKTCDIADPYQIIEWVAPEGGGGPKYVDM